MLEFLMKYGGEIITLVGTLCTAFAARWGEKKILRNHGELKDDKYYEQLRGVKSKKKE